MHCRLVRIAFVGQLQLPMDSKNGQELFMDSNLGFGWIQILISLPNPESLMLRGAVSLVRTPQH